MSSSPSVIYTVYCVKCGAAANASHEWGTWLCYPCTRYEDGLRAAEAAVAELHHPSEGKWPGPLQVRYAIEVSDAIAAIRALKEKP